MLKTYQTLSALLCLATAACSGGGAQKVSDAVTDRACANQVISTPEFEALKQQYKGLKVLPFVPAIRQSGNQLVFISGIIGFPDDYDPTHPNPGTITQQTEQIFKVLDRTLAASGLKMSNVVSIHKFLVHMEDHEAVVAVMEKHFPDHFPTSTTVEVNRLVPPGFGIEIEAIAAVPPKGCK